MIKIFNVSTLEFKDECLIPQLNYINDHITRYQKGIQLIQKMEI